MSGDTEDDCEHLRVKVQEVLQHMTMEGNMHLLYLVALAMVFGPTT